MKAGIMRYSALPFIAAAALAAAPSSATAKTLVSARSIQSVSVAAVTSGTSGLAAKNAALARENKRLRAALAHERLVNRQLRRQIARQAKQLKSYRARVKKMLATIADLKWRLSVSFGPWHTSMASTYGIGDGLLGSDLAGSGTLDTVRPVFAHKSMPFGTKVQFTCNGHTIIGECQDRGPYVGNREFDLGPKLANKLRFDGVGSVKWRVVRHK